MVLEKLFGKKSSTSSDEKKVTATEAAIAPVDKQVATNEEPSNEPTAAVHLENAMLENTRADNAETRKKVYQELLFSELLLALAEPENKDAPQPQDPNNLNVAILTNPQGAHFAAAFTSAAAARRWRAEGGHYVSVRGQDIYKLLEPSPAEVIVINAGSAPFVILPKVDYRQLAMGVVPQNQRSPVQMPEGAPTEDGQMQIAFPPDVFTDDQKAHAKNVLEASDKIEAAVFGAIQPPGNDKNNWMRTIFLRVKDIPENQEAMQKFCTDAREQIIAEGPSFKEVNFEVGVMPDPNFWVAMHQNNIIVFDKNPPAIPPQQDSNSQQG